MATEDAFSRALAPLASLRFEAAKIGRRLKRVKKFVVQVGVNRERLCVVQCFYKLNDTTSYAEYLFKGLDVSCADTDIPRGVQTQPGHAKCVVLSGRDLVSRKGRETGGIFVFCRSAEETDMLKAGVVALREAASATGFCRFTTLDATVILEAGLAYSRNNDAGSSTSGLSTRSAASFFHKGRYANGMSGSLGGGGTSALNINLSRSKKRWRKGIIGLSKRERSVSMDKPEIQRPAIGKDFSAGFEGDIPEETRYFPNHAVFSMICSACAVLRKVPAGSAPRLFAVLDSDEKRRLEALQKSFQTQQDPLPTLDRTDAAVASALLLHAFDRMPFGFFPSEDYMSYEKNMKKFLEEKAEPESSDTGRASLHALCKHLPRESLIILDQIGQLLDELCPRNLSWATTAAILSPRLVYKLRDSCTQSSRYETPILTETCEALGTAKVLLQSIARQENRSYIFEKAKLSSDTIRQTIMPFRKNGKDGTKEDLAKSFGLLTAPNGSAVLGSQDSQGGEAVALLSRAFAERATSVIDDDVGSRIMRVRHMIDIYKTRLEARPNAQNASLWKRELTEYKAEYTLLQKELPNKKSHASASQLEYINSIVQLWRGSKSLDPDQVLKRNQESGSKDPRLALLESTELLQNTLGDLEVLQNEFGHTPCRITSSIADMFRESIQLRLQLNDYHNELIMRTEDKAQEFERRFNGRVPSSPEPESPRQSFQWQPTISYLWS